MPLPKPTLPDAIKDLLPGHHDESSDPVMASPYDQARSNELVTTGVPVFVTGENDNVAKPGAEQDSWFLISHLESERGTLDLLVHYMLLTPAKPGFVQAMVSLLDPQTGRYIQEEVDYSPSECTLNPDKLEVSTATGGVSGTLDAMRWTGDWKKAGISVDLTVDCSGVPILKNAGTGILPLLGDMAYEFGYANAPTTGTVTIDGTSYTVTGPSWYDRQWGVTPRFFVEEKKRWVWFGLNLDSGESMSVWDLTEPNGSHHNWVTVLYPQGGHEVAGFATLQDEWGDIWTSPDTGNQYPTRFVFTIPEIDTELLIVTRQAQQEIVSPVGANKYEGAATVTGTRRGQPVTGRAVIELVGNGWAPGEGWAQ